MKSKAEVPTYGVGILGNCCTHGAGVARSLSAHPRLHLVAGYEPGPRRAAELGEAMEMRLAGSYREVAGHPEVDVVAVTTDPCDKAAMVELPAAAGKALYINKPLSHTPAAARQIVATVATAGVAAVFDAPMVKGLAVFDKLQRQVKAGEWGQVVSYYHAFGMTFALDFDITSAWPERFDPAAKSGGGEMTNMGCYAIDFALHMLGMPRRVEAKWQRFWQPYVEREVENFGQIALDYGRFWALLAVGKQALAGERGPRNALAVEFETANLFIDPGAEIFVHNGRTDSLAAFVGEHTAISSIDQLLAAMDGGAAPSSDVATAADGVEVLCGAYLSAQENRIVDLPLSQPRNPLFE
ncbi:MAG TPA: Gfo/Idh/MocA family oxidoreductase [Candidatus Latescibacteria bacterium]|nr:Gfo/Idh/MocA family oxidoreductase [Candidatus Latescibacterota bacterium]